MPTGYARILYVVGIVLMLLAIADVLLLRLANIDLTRKQWSGIALGGLGIICMQAARFLARPSVHETDQ